jgi:exosome complex exonuclease DIS3/RRP44
MRQHRIDRGALTLASPEVKFDIDTETHNPLDIGNLVYQFQSMIVYTMFIAIKFRANTRFFIKH